jgi:hypothetical protein
LVIRREAKLCQLAGGASLTTPQWTDRATIITVTVITRDASAIGNKVTGEGVIREALSSRYSLFPATREILRHAGPDIGASLASVGGLAIAVLNRGLRPFLTKWHSRLLAWKAQRPKDIAPQDHEKSWVHQQEFYRELDTLREELKKYATALAAIVGVSP